MKQSQFGFHDVKLTASGAVQELYKLYCKNFPLPDEQETLENFRLCLALNDNDAVQKEYGPYHEFYLAIRQNRSGFEFDFGIDGGLIFGVCTSEQHLSAGFLCSVQAIYLFRSASDSLRRFLYANRVGVEQVIVEHARAACRYPRFARIIGDSDASNIAIFFEANNPLRMLDKEKNLDKDLCHVPPARRHRMWRQNNSVPLDFHYIQPPLSAEKSPVHFLDLFALSISLDPLSTTARLARSADGRMGIPGAMLAAHLRSFFCISVLKGDAGATDLACMEAPVKSPGATAPLSVAQYCRALAEQDFIPVRGDASPETEEIDRQATESSTTTARASFHNRKRSKITGWMMSHWPRLRRHLETFAICVGTLAFTAALLGTNRGAHIVEQMDRLHGAITAIFFLVTVGAACRAVLSALRQRWRDHSPIALTTALKNIVRNLPEYRESSIADVMRSILSDRATHYLTFNALLEGMDARRLEAERPALAYFVASRFLAPNLADMDLSWFNYHVKWEADRIKRALQQFPQGIIQVLYDPTPWHAYYACTFPVRTEVLDGEVSAYERLADIEAWVDPDAASILCLPNPARTDQLRAHAQAGGEICLFVSHILDRPWDEADPGAPIETLRPHLPFEAARRLTAVQTKLARYWPEEAEFACARLLTVAAHLAMIMSRMAQSRRITTDLFCPCTVLVHVPTAPTAQLMRSLGFNELPKPEREGAPTPGELVGSLLYIRLAPESFVDLVAEGNSAADFFGLINELAQRNRREIDWTHGGIQVPERAPAPAHQG